MSSYSVKATHKRTGKVVSVDCIDDYFGKHIYGYIVGDTVYDAKLFSRFYEFGTPEDIKKREVKDGAEA